MLWRREGWPERLRHQQTRLCIACENRLRSHGLEDGAQRYVHEARRQAGAEEKLTFFVNQTHFRDMEISHTWIYKTTDEARASLFEYMEMFYNRQRRHS